MVLLQYNAKPYLGFQNLGCRCEILGCHFDTQKCSVAFSGNGARVNVCTCEIVK